MKKIMIDMDNVITDTDFLDIINNFLKTNHKLEEQETYYLQNLIKDQKKEFWTFAQDKNFYENSPLFKDCYEVLEKLNAKYEIYIVTSYLWKDEIDVSGKNLMNKYNYLRERLPFIKPEQYIFTTNKDIILADIKIDDRLKNLSGATTKILFNAWHNKIYQLKNFKKIILLEYLIGNK